MACLFLIVGYVTYGLWALGPTYLSLTACRHVYEPWLQKRSPDGNLRRVTSIGTIKPTSCVCISSYKTEGVFGRILCYRVRTHAGLLAHEQTSGITFNAGHKVGPTWIPSSSYFLDFFTFHTSIFQFLQMNSSFQRHIVFELVLNAFTFFFIYYIHQSFQSSS